MDMLWAGLWMIVCTFMMVGVVTLYQGCKLYKLGKKIVLPNLINHELVKQGARKKAQTEWERRIKKVGDSHG